jgi:ribonuclease HI
MKYGKRFTTVNTDAGLKNDGSAAFACWIRSESYLIKAAGPLTSKPKNSNEAELAAILNALHIVSKDEYLRTADIIVVNCDNKQALKVLRDRRINGYEKYSAFYKTLLTKISCPIYYKHVKGHTKGRQPREWVNNWCDKTLRKHY